MYFMIYLFYLLFIVFVSRLERKLLKGKDLCLFTDVSQRMVTIHLSSQPGVKGGVIFWDILSINQDFFPLSSYPKVQS